MGFSLILRAFFSFPNERQFIECQFFWKFRYLAKNHIFKIILLVATVVLAALQGVAEMEEDSVTNNIL